MRLVQRARFIQCARFARHGVSCIALAAAAFAGGCASVSSFYGNLVGQNDTQQVAPTQFVQRRVVNEAPLSPVDKSGQLAVDNPRLTPSVQSPTATASPASATPRPADQDRGISKVVENAIRPPGQDPSIVTSAGPTTVPSTGPSEAVGPSLASGGYMVLGGVVAEVNGTPIYANKVLGLLGPTLKNLAREMDQDRFSVAARDKIERQIGELERNELDYAAAERNLDNGDKNLVDALATAYRRKLVTEAGGSVEVARRKAAASGDDFDEMIRQQYRLYMIQLYYQKKFGPRLQVGAADMRRFYQQNKDKVFTVFAQAAFDLIKIDPANFQSGSPVEDRRLAYEKARECHDRAANGANFATLFKEYNNDPGLALATNNTGAMGTYQKGSFNIPEVESAVWSLQPGKVSDVVNVKGVLYVAKMESRKEGSVQQFEDEDVQERISNILRSQQLSVLREQEQQKLLERAIIRTDPQMIDTAVDMSLQNYSLWAAK